MGRALVAYFSASGTTEKLAKRMAEILNADIFEIKPEIPYSKTDLNWSNRQSRSSMEMKDMYARPAMKGRCENIADYDTVFLGFPIWWYLAPRIVNTFLEAHDLKGKTIIPFATSGGSKMGDTNKELKISCPDSDLREGKVFNSSSDDELLRWIGGMRK